MASKKNTNKQYQTDLDTTKEETTTKLKMKRQGIFFGILTSIMTIIPFQIGIVASGEVNSKEVMSGIVSMAVADSMADAYGIFFSNEASDSKLKQSDAVLASAITFVTKIVIQLSFAVPFLLTQGVLVPTAINCVWGLVVLLIATYQVAKIRGVSTTVYMVRSSLFTGAIIAGSYWLTKIMSQQKNESLPKS